jgi:hypothetical protein
MINNSRLQNKKILFLSVQTFNLEVEIKAKLEDFGAIVTFYDERPANNNIVKGLIRFKRSLLQNKIDQYYSKILSNTANVQFDFLFVNRGEVVPEFFLKEFRKVQSSCIFIFYTWDSFTNHAHPINILKYFDRKFTFDPNDAIKYDLNFRPLFFLNSFKDIKNKSNNEICYNLLFLGTAHSDRFRIVTEIVNWCSRNNLTYFCYYFLQGRLVFLYKKLLDKSFKEFEYNKLSFNSLDLNSIIELYKKSNVILDINHPGQTGLTMRTFESIGANKKLITTNSEIKKYCFYNPKNILVIDRNNIKIEKRIFDSEYEDIESEIYDKLSIDGWINCLFFDSESNYWISNLK